jgi:hypothetical protein
MAKMTKSEKQYAVNRISDIISKLKTKRKKTIPKCNTIEEALNGLEKGTFELVQDSYYKHRFSVVSINSKSIQFSNNKTNTALGKEAQKLKDAIWLGDVEQALQAIQKANEL